MNDVTNEQLHNEIAALHRAVNEIQSALTGNMIDGSPGLLGRIRDRERVAENHDLRLVALETKAEQFAEQKELNTLEQKVEENGDQLKVWRGQLRLLAWASGGGGVAGVVSLIVTLLRMFG